MVRQLRSAFTPDALATFDETMDEVWRELLADGVLSPAAFGAGQTRGNFAVATPDATTQLHPTEREGLPRPCVVAAKTFRTADKTPRNFTPSHVGDSVKIAGVPVPARKKTS